MIHLISTLTVIYYMKRRGHFHLSSGNTIIILTSPWYKSAELRKKAVYIYVRLCNYLKYKNDYET